MSSQEQKVTEEARLRIIQNRRNEIRATLRGAEKLRNFRLENGFVPEIDPSTGKPVKNSDSKFALSITAFVVAAGAIAVRVGGRAALLSAVGLDFLSESPELKQNLDFVLQTSDSMDIGLKVAAFTLAWTAVKILCFDAAGVVLALASGILFGGVVQGAIMSAAAATAGSLVAFGLAKLDTPVRKQALDLLDQYPSLRGIDKVVARDGLKAVLTLRLAPVLPIPIGLYNYIYGVTNVPIPAFAGGIFLGSLKPYFLDSYLGYFGKDLVQGNIDPSGLQDTLLIGALAVSVLIGVFASQLASETWDTVLEEIETEKKNKSAISADNATIINDDDGIVRTIFNFDVPEWIVGFQIALKMADVKTNELVLSEVHAAVWNYTNPESVPDSSNPKNYWNSPELVEKNCAIDLGASLCEGLVLSPILFTTFLKYSNPLYSAATDTELIEFFSRHRSSVFQEEQDDKTVEKNYIDIEKVRQQLDFVKKLAVERIQLLDDKLER